MSAESLWAQLTLRDPPRPEFPGGGRGEQHGPRRLRRRDVLVLVGFLAVLPLGCWITMNVIGTILFVESGLTYANPGPGNPYRAWVTSSDCGATCRFNTWVTLRAGSGKKGLPFEGESTTVFQGSIAPTTISLKWESPTVLVIEYDERDQSRVARAVTVWKEVTIIHRPRKP